MEDILYGIHAVSDMELARQVAANPQAYAKAIKNAATQADIASKDRSRLAVERIAKLFFPADVQEGLRKGTLQLGYQNIYGTVALDAAAKTVFTTNENKAKGVRNIQNRTTDAKSHLVVTKVSYKSVVNATLGVGAFGAPAADTLAGNITLQIGTATIWEDQGLRMFDRGGNTTVENGTLVLASPFYLPPSTSIKADLDLIATPATNTQAQLMFEGLGVAPAPSVR